MRAALIPVFRSVATHRPSPSASGSSGVARRGSGHPVTPCAAGHPSRPPADARRRALGWQHPGTPAYCRDLDADGLKAALAQADAGQIAGYRAQADEAARPYCAE